MSAPAHSLPRLLGDALAHHQAGRHDPAAAGYREILRQAPENPDALHLLGVLTADQGDAEAAIALLNRAIQADPRKAEFHYHLGNVLAGAGQFAEAAQSYRRAVGISPTFIDARFNLARALTDAKQFDGAREAYEALIAIDPAVTAAHYNLGNLLHRMGQYEQAESAFRRCLALEPGKAEAWCNLGGALKARRRYDDALKALGNAIDLRPNLALAHFMRAEILRTEERQDEAATAYAAALAAAPGSIDAHFGMANVLFAQARFAEAVDHYRAVIAARPELVEPRSNLGNALMNLGRVDEAIEAYRGGVAMAPDSPRAHCNLALALMLAGQHREGLDEWEWRLRDDDGVDPCTNAGGPTLPAWDGRNPAGRAILVQGEQGPGDIVMFAPCLRDLVDAGARVTLRCTPRLTALMARSFPAIQVVPEGTSVTADFTIALGSLLRLYRTEAAHFRRPARYLAPDPSAVERWRERYRAIGGGTVVGISWRGGITPNERRLRAMQIEDWLPVLRLPGIRFVSLQYGDRAADLALLRDRHGIIVHDWPEAVADLDDFAAQIDALDMVVSVANTTVHFAGALAKPVWTLAPPAPSWRWQLGRADSPWYPTMIIHRQAFDEPWQAVLTRIAALLPPANGRQ